MKPIYVPHAGDLYEIYLDIEGNIVECNVRWDNKSRPPEPIEPADVPQIVIEKMVNQLLNFSAKKNK